MQKCWAEMVFGEVLIFLAVGFKLENFNWFSKRILQNRSFGILNRALTNFFYY